MAKMITSFTFTPLAVDNATSGIFITLKKNMIGTIDNIEGVESINSFDGISKNEKYYGSLTLLR